MDRTDQKEKREIQGSMGGQGCLEGKVSRENWVLQGPLEPQARRDWSDPRVTEAWMESWGPKELRERRAKGAPQVSLAPQAPEE